MAETFHWLDVDRIAEELYDTYPKQDPMTVRFPDLRQMVTQLEGFVEQQGHPVNERILEAIQMAWAREREEGVDIELDYDDDEDEER